jgi:hypothetical protein
MTTRYTGSWMIYGPPGIGKTSSAISYIMEKCNPANCDFYDGDQGGIKSLELCKSLGINHHNIFAGGLDKTEVDIVSGFLEQVKKGLKKKKDAIVVDVPNIIFDGAHSYVTQNEKNFRQVLSGDGAIKTATRWGVARRQFLPTIYEALSQQANIVFWLFHEKEQSIKGQKTGLMESSADDTLVKACSAIIRLSNTYRDNEHPELGVPVGLVVKQSVGSIISDKHKFMLSPLPQRIPQFTWDDVDNYIETYSRGRKWPQENLPSEMEADLIRGQISPDVYEATKAWAKKTLIEKETAIREAVLEKAGNLQANMMNATKVLNELQGQFDATDLDVKKVLAIMQGK